MSLGHVNIKRTEYLKLWIRSIRMEEGAINKLISLRGRSGVTIWGDSEDSHLPQHLAKPGDIIAIMNI